MFGDGFRWRPPAFPGIFPFPPPFPDKSSSQTLRNPSLSLLGVKEDEEGGGSRFMPGMSQGGSCLAPRTKNLFYFPHTFCLVRPTFFFSILVSHSFALAGHV